MLFNTLASVLALAGAAVAHPKNHKRDTDTTSIKLYAYGKGISGYQVLAGPNDTAVIAAASSDNMNELTWNTPTTDTTFNATLNTTSYPDAPPVRFYIRTDSTAYEPCGLANTNTTAPTDAATTGFTIYGKQVMWMNGTSLSSQFWAKTTSTDVFQLYWNAAGLDQADSVPVTIKTTAPSSITKMM